MFRHTILAFGMLTLLANANLSYAQLISAWHFNESSGTTAADFVGSVNGNLVGSSSFVAGGISGNAVSVTPGGGGFVDMGNNFAFTGATTFSIVSWVKLNPGDTTGYIVAGRHRATEISGYFQSINNAGSGSGEVTGGATFYQSYTNPVSTNLNLNDGNWHQLVGVHDVANNQARLYVDGVLRDTELANNGFSSSAANFAIGGILNPAGTQMINSLNGFVDEVSLWSTALTDPEVLYLYNNPTGVPEPTSMALLAVAGVGAVVRRRIRRRAAA